MSDFKLSNFDMGQVIRASFDEETSSLRVKMDNVTIKAEQQSNESVRIERIEVPVIVKEPVQITVPQPELITEVRIERIEVPVIVKETEIKEIKVPHVLQNIQLVDKPIIIEKENESDRSLIKVAIFLNSVGILFMGLALLIK